MRSQPGLLDVSCHCMLLPLHWEGAQALCAQVLLHRARHLGCIISTSHRCTLCGASQVSDEHFDHLDDATEEEEDMLDEATCLTATSRLGCQIILSKQIEGLEVTLPAYSRNYYVDGFVPEPH